MTSNEVQHPNVFCFSAKLLQVEHFWKYHCFPFPMFYVSIVSENISFYPLAIYFSFFLNCHILPIARSNCIIYETFQKSNSTSQFPPLLPYFRPHQSLPFSLATMPLLVPPSTIHYIYPYILFHKSLGWLFSYQIVYSVLKYLGWLLIAYYGDKKLEVSRIHLAYIIIFGGGCYRLQLILKISCQKF